MFMSNTSNMSNMSNISAEFYLNPGQYAVVSNCGCIDERLIACNLLRYESIVLVTEDVNYEILKQVFSEGLGIVVLTSDF